MDASFKRSLRKVCPGNNDLCFYISWTLLFFLTQLSAVPEILVKNLWSVDTFVVSNEPVNANFDVFSKYNVFPHPKKETCCYSRTVVFSRSMIRVSSFFQSYWGSTPGQIDLNEYVGPQEEKKKTAWKVWCMINITDSNTASFECVRHGNH